MCTVRITVLDVLFTARAPRCPLHDSVPFVLHSHAKRHAHATATTATANTNNDVCTSVDIG